MKLDFGDDYFTIHHNLRIIINKDIDRVPKTDDNKFYLDRAVKQANELFRGIEEAYENINRDELDDCIFKLMDTHKIELVEILVREFMVQCIYPYFELINKEWERMTEISNYIRGDKYTFLGLFGIPLKGFPLHGVYLKEKQAVYIVDKYFPLLRKNIEREKDMQENDNIREHTGGIQMMNDIFSGSKEEIVFCKAKDRGIIKEVENGYKWNRSKAILAYFVECMNDRFNLGKGEYNGEKKISWIEFEVMFGVSGLAQARMNYKNNISEKPGGYKEIDDLFL